MQTVINCHGLLYRVETFANPSAKTETFATKTVFRGETILGLEVGKESEYHSKMRDIAKRHGFSIDNNSSSIIN